MRIAINKNHKKRNIILTISALVFSAGVASALLIPSSPFSLNKKQEDRAENTVNYKTPSSDQKQAGDKAKEDFIKKQAAADDAQSKSNQSGSSSNTVNITISSAKQVDQVYQIRTILSAIDDNGTCTLTLSKTGQGPVTQVVGTQTLGSYSVCKGFDVTTAGLEKGDWQVNIAYKGSAGQGSVRQTLGL